MMYQSSFGPANFFWGHASTRLCKYLTGLASSVPRLSLPWGILCLYAPKYALGVQQYAPHIQLHQFKLAALEQPASKGANKTNTSNSSGNSNNTKSDYIYVYYSTFLPPSVQIISTNNSFLHFPIFHFSSYHPIPPLSLR